MTKKIKGLRGAFSAKVELYLIEKSVGINIFLFLLLCPAHKVYILSLRHEIRAMYQL